MTYVQWIWQSSQTVALLWGDIGIQIHFQNLRIRCRHSHLNQVTWSFICFCLKVKNSLMFEPSKLNHQSNFFKFNGASFKMFVSFEWRGFNLRTELCLIILFGNLYLQFSHNCPPESFRLICTFEYSVELDGYVTFWTFWLEVPFLRSGAMPWPASSQQV